MFQQKQLLDHAPRQADEMATHTAIAICPRAILRKSCAISDFRCGSKPVLTATKRHFRVTPSNGHRQYGPVGPVGARKRLMHCSKQGFYWSPHRRAQRRRDNKAERRGGFEIDDRPVGILSVVVSARLLAARPLRYCRRCRSCDIRPRCPDRNSSVRPPS
jgi:hypothetical protein